MKTRKIVQSLAALFVSFASLVASPKRNADGKRYYLPSTDARVQRLISSLSNAQGERVLNTYAAVYYQNLRRNFPTNSQGTCSFVGISMMLSFWDSYMDDDFVPEEFEVGTAYSPSLGDDLPNDLPQFDVESPGVYSERSIGTSEPKEDFQEYLIGMANDMFGKECFESTDYPYGLTLYEQTHLSMYYLMYRRGITSNGAVVTCCDNASDIHDYVVSHITSGMPVMLNVSTLAGPHSVVAYDYNEGTNKLFVHTGWGGNDGNALTHVSLEQLGSSWSRIKSAMTIEGRSPGSAYERNHYISTSGKKVGAESFVYPRNLRLVSAAFADVAPTFKWESLYEEKWYVDYAPYIEFTVLNSNKWALYTINLTGENRFTLPIAVWNNLLYKDPFSDFWIRIKLRSDNHQFEENVCEGKFIKPSTQSECAQFSIIPNDYQGIYDQYTANEANRDTFISHRSASGVLFKTRRFRAGRFNSQRIVLSPKKRGFSEAFIEYQFSVPVDRVDIELSLWGSRWQEGLYSNSALAVVEVYRYDEYETIVDLLAEQSLIPAGWSNRKTYSLCFERPITRFRVRASTKEQNTNQNDLGRICIGGIRIYENSAYRDHETIEEMPTSGFEVPYDPQYWEIHEGWMYNCYSYALNDYFAFQPHPGQYAYEKGCQNNFFNLWKYDFDTYCSYGTIVQMVEQDSEYFISGESGQRGFTFRGIDKNAKCSNGCYKIALVFDLVSTAYDYHWYRQGPDGFWSHKPAAGLVRDFDFDGNPIYDPAYCNKMSSEDINREKNGIAEHYYHAPVYYFEVSPLYPTPEL